MFRHDRDRRAAALAVLGAAIGMAGGFAVVVVAPFGIFVKPIAADLGWNRADVSLLLTMALLGYAIGSPIIGRLYDRLGVRRVQATAIVAFALGIAGLALLPASRPVLAGTMLWIGLASAATAPSGYVLILAKRFQARLGAVMACAMVGTGIGIVVAPALALALLTALGWRGAYLALAALALVAGGMALALGVGRETDDRATAPGLDAAASGLTLAEALHDWRFWLVALSALAIGIAGFGVQAHLAAALTDAGLTSEIAVRLVGLLGLGLMTGRIGAALAMDRFFAPGVAILCYGLGAVGLVLLAETTSDRVAVLAFASFAVGLLTGSEGDVMPFLTRHYFGLRAFGSIFGCVLGFAGIGGLIGPLAMGLSFDLTGGYRWGLDVAAMLCVVSGGSLLLLGPYRYSFLRTGSEPRRP